MNIRIFKPLLIFSFVVFALSACNSEQETTQYEPEPEPESEPNELRALIEQHKLTGSPVNINGNTDHKRTNIPDISSDMAQLGKDLFFTKAYSLNNDVACASCHHPFLAGMDALSLPVGVDALNPDLLGIGRAHNSFKPSHDGTLMGPRNSPTTFNVVFYDEQQFWDGKVETVNKTPGAAGYNEVVITPRMRMKAIADASEAIKNNTFDFTRGVTPDLTDPRVKPANSLSANQVRFPITSAIEMRGFKDTNADMGFEETWEAINLRFQGKDKFMPNNQWLAKFRQAFNAPTASVEELVHDENISIAIGEYENSQVFINNAWKRYVEGDETAISDDAKEGAKLFFKPLAQGGANCVSCHSGDFFTDEKFHIVGMPQIGRGKPNPAGNNTTDNDDQGRFLLTMKQSDQFKWRTPSLLNVALTGPWGHAGAYTSLRKVVEHYNNPQLAIDNYDFSQIDPTINTVNMKANTQAALDRMQVFRDANNSSNVPLEEKLNLNDTQIDQLVLFLQTLTDPCILDKDCMAPWVPDNFSPDPDGYRLNPSFTQTIAQ